MRSLLLATAFLLPQIALADATDVVVEGAWSRASLAEGRPGVAYMTLTNTGEEPVTLTGIETEVAAMPEVHETKSDGGMMSMGPAGPLTIDPGESLALQPGGYHVMLMKMTRMLEEGDSYALTLTFEHGAEREVEVPVLGVSATGPEED